MTPSRRLIFQSMAPQVKDPLVKTVPLGKRQVKGVASFSDRVPQDNSFDGEITPISNA